MKTFKMPATEHSSFPLLSKAYKPTEVTYTLYRKVNGRFKRVSEHAYPIKMAVKVFSSRIGENALEYDIKPAEPMLPKAKAGASNGSQRFARRFAPYNVISRAR